MVLRVDKELTMDYKVTRDNSYLAHHGVLGMRWGVRRYQNKDGSLKRSVKADLKNKRKLYKESTKTDDPKKISKAYNDYLTTRIKSDRLNSKNPEKAELRTYAKEYVRNGGINDGVVTRNAYNNINLNTLSNRVITQKGENYYVKMQNQSIKEMRKRDVETILKATGTMVGLTALLGTVITRMPG